MTPAPAPGSQRFAHLEIEITSACEMACPCCDRFVDVAPPPPPERHMTLDQIRGFVAESGTLDWRWERIHVLGGEPTLHPDFRAVLEVLLEYRRAHPWLLLRVISNGGGKLRDFRNWILDRGIVLNVEAKSPRTLPAWFSNMRRAPKDVTGNPGAIGPCSIFGIKGCGLGLTRHGYFLCGAGAAIARVVGLDVGVQRLADVTYPRMLEQAAALCNLCGHHESTRVIASRDPGGSSCSPFWKAALERYKLRGPPPMTVYAPGGSP